MKVFVSKDIEITRGTGAESLIRQKNESKYFEPGVGIKKIDLERWQEAQYYERKTWCASPSMELISDHNEEHLIHFNNYESIDDLGDNLSVIELGCGPFTNMRFILYRIGKRVESVSLLDPLINDYIQSAPNCTYKNGELAGKKIKTFAMPIEEFVAPEKYDVVVMINVLDHCFDIDLIFEKISAMLNEGGILVFMERAYDESVLKQSLETIYDAGHPIRITEAYLENKIKSYKTLYRNEFISDFLIYKYLILKNESDSNTPASTL